jgi:hypothetical protein
VDKTLSGANLENERDYSLMLFINSPPLSISSALFTIRSASGGLDLAKLPLPTPDFHKTMQCLISMGSHGGSYNDSADPDFTRGNYYQQAPQLQSKTKLDIITSGTGTTKLSFQSYGADVGRKTQTVLDKINLDLITESYLGMGILSLNMMQAARELDVEMNVIALNLGTEGHPGSVVLGGYDDALVNHEQSAVFDKGSDLSNVYKVSFLGLSFRGRDKEVTLFNRTAGAATDATLVYDAPGIRLSKAIIDSILPLVGNPVLDEGLNAYVYDGIPNTDFTLTFKIHNGTVPVNVTIPGSALVTTDTAEDNPLTSVNETGKTYLRIAPTVAGTSDAIYLGRCFLQHVYIIDSPPNIGKFHLSAVTDPLPTIKNLIPASPSSLSIFGIAAPQSVSQPRVGAIAGGVCGGVFFLLGMSYVCHNFLNRKNWRRFVIPCSCSCMGSGIILKHSSTQSSFFNDAGYDHRLGNALNSHRMSKSNSVRTMATIPIHYSSQYDKEVGYVHPGTLFPTPTTRFSLPTPVRYPAYTTRLADSATQIQQAGHLGSPQSLDRSRRFSLSQSLNRHRLSTVSAIQRRKSETSTVAREYLVDPDPIDKPLPEAAAVLIQNAAEGRVCPPTKIQSPTHLPPVLPLNLTVMKSLTRATSLAKVATPVEVEVVLPHHRSMPALTYKRISSSTRGDRRISSSTRGDVSLIGNFAEDVARFVGGGFSPIVISHTRSSSAVLPDDATGIGVESIISEGEVAVVVVEMDAAAHGLGVDTSGSLGSPGSPDNESNEVDGSDKELDSDLDTSYDARMSTIAAASRQSSGSEVDEVFGLRAVRGEEGWGARYRAQAAGAWFLEASSRGGSSGSDTRSQPEPYRGRADWIRRR